MSLFLGVDMGGTASRWCLVDAGGVEVARGSAAGASGLVQDPKVATGLSAALEEIAAALPERPAACHCGITGAGFTPKAGIAERISAAFALPTECIGYSNDMVLAWHAAFPEGGPGHLVSAGTGSIGITLDEAGVPHAVGGRGTLIDDAGSGAWIALRALDRVLRRVDETGGPEGCEILAKALSRRIGGLDHASVTGYVYRGDRGAIGMLSPAVAEAAREGDRMALDLLGEAGHELLRLARALIARKGPAEVVFTGGAVELHPLIRETIEAGLAGHPDGLRFARLDPALQGARMARALVTEGERG